MDKALVLLTGNPGTEDVIAGEAGEELPSSEVVELRKGYGRVVVRVDERILERVYSMRSIHSATLLLALEEGIPGTPEGLERVGESIRESMAVDLIPYGGSFAVRVTRYGDHSFNSLDLARVAGDAIIRAALEKRGFRPEVRLTSPAVVFKLDLIEDKLYFGVSLSGDESLHRRGIRIYDHPAALKPTLAYAMLRISGARDGDLIVDPMCGGGTIAIEAALLFPTSRIYCIDLNPSHVRGALLNSLAARVHGRIEFIVGDARRLHEILGPGSIDVVVSNPPYGIRLGSPSEVRALYRRFLESLSQALKDGGRATLITTESDFVIRESRRHRLKLSHIRRVRHGDLWASILVLEKG